MPNFDFAKRRDRLAGSHEPSGPGQRAFLIFHPRLHLVERATSISPSTERALRTTFLPPQERHQSFPWNNLVNRRLNLSRLPMSP